MYELSHELLNNLKLRISGNFKVTPEMLGIERHVLSWAPKRQRLTVILQNCKKSVVIYSVESLRYCILLICLPYFVRGCSVAMLGLTYLE